MDNDVGKKRIPLTHGLEVRVILGGIVAGSVRSVVETPLEYAKVGLSSRAHLLKRILFKDRYLRSKIKRQTGENWKLRSSYTGFGITLTRCCALMPTYFIVLDTFRRNFDDFFR
jgi:solute carrier family 25 carnitine/acylcarnitine transporter 20/29